MSEGLTYKNIQAFEGCLPFIPETYTGNRSDMTNVLYVRAMTPEERLVSILYRGMSRRSVRRAELRVRKAVNRMISEGKLEAR